MTQVQKLTHTRGDTFRLTCSLSLDSKTPVDITDWGIEGDIWDGATSIADLTLTKVNPALGQYSLYMIDTDTWPTKDLLARIRYTSPGGDKVSTRRFYVSVEPGAPL